MVGDVQAWSEETFGDSNLSDARRTKRLVKIAGAMAKQMGHSLSRSCAGDQAQLLGGYRLLRNDEVKPEEILAGGFKSTVRQAQASELLLAMEDTTVVSYEHSAREELGITGTKKEAKKRG